MKLSDIKKQIPEQLYEILKDDVEHLRPAQIKAVKAGLLEGKNLLVCTPTASGKTLIAELAMLTKILHYEGKAIYIVPLKSLATEKHNDFRKKYNNVAKMAVAIGDLDSADPYLDKYDIITCTSEKLDSLIRHQTPWLSKVKIIVIDEIHLLNDAERGPTLEILITLLRKLLPKVQVLGLSATIGNPKELANWLNASLVEDDWRPVKLEKGICFENKVEMF
ncbi:MAG: DEAD/DEAH box helicase [Candidatus Woesearchaeota archaeon]